jgi:hypothetical protein
MDTACTPFRPTPQEALRGFTVNGAHSPALHDRGRGDQAASLNRRSQQD